MYQNSPLNCLAHQCCRLWDEPMLPPRCTPVSSGKAEIGLTESSAGGCPQWRWLCPTTSSPCPVTVFILRWAHGSVWHVILTLYVTKYPCPLNIKEMEPTLDKRFLKGSRLQKDSLWAQRHQRPFPDVEEQRMCGVSWVPAAEGSRMCAVYTSLRRECTTRARAGDRQPSPADPLTVPEPRSPPRPGRSQRRPSRLCPKRERLPLSG